MFVQQTAQNIAVGIDVNAEHGHGNQFFACACTLGDVTTVKVGCRVVVGVPQRKAQRQTVVIAVGKFRCAMLEVDGACVVGRRINVGITVGLRFVGTFGCLGENLFDILVCSGIAVAVNYNVTVRKVTLVIYKTSFGVGCTLFLKPWNGNTAGSGYAVFVSCDALPFR